MAFIFGPSSNGTEIITYMNEAEETSKKKNCIQIDEEMVWFFSAFFWYSNVKLFTFDFIFLPAGYACGMS